MKRIILFAVLVFGVFAMNAQHLDYNNLKNVKSKAMSYVDFTSYTASDGTTIKIGDYVEFGESSGENFYRYIMTYVPMTSPVYIKSGFAGRKYEVVRITVNGKDENKHVGIWTKTDFAGKYLIDCEPALKYGELVGDGMTSDAALAELEKEKKKFDLGIITEEEYNQKKSELIKYIK